MSIFNSTLTALLTLTLLGCGGSNGDENDNAAQALSNGKTKELTFSDTEEGAWCVEQRALSDKEEIEADGVHKFDANSSIYPLSFSLENLVGKFPEYFRTYDVATIDGGFEDNLPTSDYFNNDPQYVRTGLQSAKVIQDFAADYQDDGLVNHISFWVYNPSDDFVAIRFDLISEKYTCDERFKDEWSITGLSKHQELLLDPQLWTKVSFDTQEDATKAMIKISTFDKYEPKDPPKTFYVDDIVLSYK